MTSRSKSRSPADDELTVTVDIGYGGAFYAIVDDRQLGLDVSTSPTADIVDAASAVTGSFTIKSVNQSIYFSRRQYARQFRNTNTLKATRKATLLVELAYHTLCHLMNPNTSF